MTSANVIEYTIFNKAGKAIGEHRQHLMCKSRWDELFKYHPIGDHTIQPHGYDEEEEEWEGEIYNLYDFLVTVGEIQLK